MLDSHRIKALVTRVRLRGLPQSARRSRHSKGLEMGTRRILIVGAAGRDFHNFNRVFRDDHGSRVVAFTAAQIPDIDGRVYPADLAGPQYPDGIPIHDESKLEELIERESVDEVVFSYSDVSHEHVMHLASRALACGADYRLLGPKSTELKSTRPVVAICAVRTGSGKSQTTRRVARVLQDAGLRVVAIRHPMPYGDLAIQRCQRFGDMADLDRHACTIEEREEYEPHLAAGTIVYAGIEYAEILRQAESEAQVVIWDGGNNDLPFITPDVHLVVMDPLRVGHEERFHPGEANARSADAYVVNKIDSARQEDVDSIVATCKRLRPGAAIVMAESIVSIESGHSLAGQRVLAIEDGPTATHGGMKFGAAVVAARRGGARQIVDPRPLAVRSIAETFRKYPDAGEVLPAMGYSASQIADLQETINRAADLVDQYLIGTPIDLRRLVRFPKPAVRVTYELRERGTPDIASVLEPLIRKARA